jgi:cytochrome c oxidase accessory protein FixG
VSDKKAIQLFAKQQRIYPQRVWGRYRKVKWLVMLVTLGIYYLAPWLRWDRGEGIPDQAILIDIPHSRAYFFFIEIWPQEIYYITGLLILGAIGLFFVTSLFGRIWCGYTCPQTVWTDLFVWVERIFQGNRNIRMRLDKAPWSFNKIWRKLATHFTWLLIALCTGGAWVFYFNDAPTLMEQILHLDIPASVLGWIVALTFSTYFMAGYAREQVCTYMCPYSRFQSAMFDKDSLIIGYDKARGEVRGKHKAGDSWEGRGHCVDCKMCVNVCPVGIDIRDGLQMECIACGMCIDACNNIMDKLGLPHGLVRYDTIRNQQYRAQGKEKTVRMLRPRTFYYAAILLLVGMVMLYGLLNRSPLELHVLHDRNPLFVKLSDGTIRNGYNIKILNKTHQDRQYRLVVSGIDSLQIRVQGAGNPDSTALPVFADSVGNFKVFVKASAQTQDREAVTFSLYDLDDEVQDVYQSVFISR